MQILLSTFRRAVVILVLSSFTACSAFHPNVALEKISGPASGNDTGLPISQSQPLPMLPSPVLKVNAEVRREMNSYLRRRNIEISLIRREEHYDTLRKIFIDQGVPEELLNLALVESGFNTHARSRAGAVGMWQFMKSTAQAYGLTVGLFRDDRRDPILSTLAAARHLRDLYMNYNDWYLALAAYNAGPAAVDRAIRRSGLTDFWSLARAGKLCRQTQEFVPRFIAATLIASNPVAYGVSPNVDPDDDTRLAEEQLADARSSQRSPDV